MSEATNITVQGMTCGHCVSAVTSELNKLPGVTDVEITLDTGAVAITSNGPLSDADVRAAIEEAGYEMSS